MSRRPRQGAAELKFGGRNDFLVVDVNRESDGKVQGKAGTPYRARRSILCK